MVVVSIERGSCAEETRCWGGQLVQPSWGACFHAEHDGYELLPEERERERESERERWWGEWASIVIISVDEKGENERKRFRQWWDHKYAQIQNDC